MTDPRGPIRQIISIERTAYEVLAVLSCGHVGSFATYFSYKVGSAHRCYQCRKESEK